MLVYPCGLDVSSRSLRFLADRLREHREAVDLLATLAPTLDEAVRAAKAYVRLDGTLLPIDWGYLPAGGWGTSPPTGPSTRESTRDTG